MKRLFTLLFFAAFTLTATGSGIVTVEVLVVSGGKFGDPNNYVRIGSYNPQTGVYAVFDSIRANSTKSAIVPKSGFDSIAFVTADTVILKYDLNSRARLAVSPKATGLTYLAYYESAQNDKYVLATRGFGADSDYVQVFHAGDLSLAYTIKGISGQSAGIVVEGDTAYVAVPGAFGTPTGKIAVIDLKNMMLDREIDLDTLGVGIDRLIGAGNLENDRSIYAVIDKHNQLVTINPSTGAVTFMSLGKETGRAFTRGKHSGGYAMYIELNGASAGRYRLSSQSFVSDTVVSYSKMGVSGWWDIANIGYAEHGSVGKWLYVSATDFASYGRVFVLDTSGTITDTFETGISPEAIAFRHMTFGGFVEGKNAALRLKTYPNPASSQITCELPEISSGSYRVLSLTGQVVGQGSFAGEKSLSINVQWLKKGMYFIQVNTGKGTGTTRFVRE